jgi:hypothetical protein
MRAKRLRVSPVRDPGVIDALDALERYARAFDAISAEQDAHYSARSFVRWVRLEAKVRRDGEQRPSEVGRTVEAA